VGGFVFPFVMSGLIDRFGYKAGMCGVVSETVPSQDD
jgi:hypothetical protein